MIARYTIDYDGEPVPVTNFLDLDGEGIDSPEDAFSVVAGPLPSGSWIAFEIGLYELRKVN